MNSYFLLKHDEIVKALKARYPSENVVDSEVAMSYASYPAIGIFLGISEHSKETRAYVPIYYTYILCYFDIFDPDNPNDQIDKMRSTFDKLEQIITDMDFQVLTDIEPIVSIGIGEGSFITGWTTSIGFN